MSQTPDWLNNQFLENILKKYYKNDGIKVANFEAKSTLANGEGYMSSMYRAKVNYSVPSQNEVSQFSWFLLKYFASCIHCTC